MAAEIDQKAIRELLDKAALQELVLRYARYTDRRDLKNLRTLYHDDAIEDRGSMFRGGIDAFLEFVAASTSNFELTMHRISNMLFVVDGDQAQGEIYGEAYHRTHPPDQKDIVAYGRYLDRYERRGGVWKFSYRTSTSDRCEVRDVDPAWYKQFVAAAPLGLPNADDLSYRVLTMFEKR